MGRVLTAAVLWTTCTCSGDLKADLLLDLRTDLQPGLEFAEVRTELFERIPASSDRASAGNVEVRAVSVTDAFVRGERIAVFTGLRPGNHIVRVRLVDRQGIAFLQRIALLTVRKTSVFTIVMTRDCRGVECPGPDDDPSAIACLGGRCVSPECTPEAQEFCPTGVCEVDVTCVAAAACARAQCTDEGTCLRVGDNGACPAGQWCNPDVGCVPLPDPLLTADASTTEVAVTTGAARNPAIAWNGADLGMVWEEERPAGGASEAYFVRVDLVGNRLGAEVPLSSGGGYNPAIEWNPDVGEFMAVWPTAALAPGDIAFSRLDSAGALLGGGTLTSNGRSQRLHVRWNGTVYGVTWLEDPPLDVSRGFFAALDASGSVAAAPIALSQSGDSQDVPSIAWNGTRWGATWHNDGFMGVTSSRPFGYDVGFTLNDETGSRDGDVVFLAPTATGGQGRDPDVVWTGDAFGVVWWDSRGDGLGSYFARLGPDGSLEVAEKRLHAPETFLAFRPVIRWDGQRFGVAWTEEVGGQRDVRLMWIDRDGNVLGGPMQLSSTAAGEVAGDPWMIWNGTSYVVVWHKDLPSGDAVLELAVVTVR